MNMMSKHTCWDRPLPTCKASIVVTATHLPYSKPIQRKPEKRWRGRRPRHLLWWIMADDGWWWMIMDANGWRRMMSHDDEPRWGIAEDDGRWWMMMMMDNNDDDDDGWTLLCKTNSHVEHRQTGFAQDLAYQPIRRHEVITHGMKNGNRCFRLEENSLGTLVCSTCIPKPSLMLHNKQHKIASCINHGNVHYAGWMQCQSCSLLGLHELPQWLDHQYAELWPRAVEHACGYACVLLLLVTAHCSLKARQIKSSNF